MHKEKGKKRGSKILPVSDGKQPVLLKPVTLHTVHVAFADFYWQDSKITTFPKKREKKKSSFISLYPKTILFRGYKAPAE